MMRHVCPFSHLLVPEFGEDTVWLEINPLKTVIVKFSAFIAELKKKGIKHLPVSPLPHGRVINFHDYICYTLENGCGLEEGEKLVGIANQIGCEIDFSKLHPLKTGS